MRTKTGSITLEDVARAAGVSRATASRVVRGEKIVGDEKVAAVMNAVAELGYVPNVAARQLVTRRANTVALIIAEPDLIVFTDPFFARIAIVLSRALGEKDVQLVTAFPDSVGGFRRMVSFLREGRVDGAIIVSHHKDARQIAAYADSPIPVVFIGRPLVEDPPASWVDLDNVEGGRLAAGALLDAGVRSPAIVTGTMNMVASKDRLAGFRAAMKEKGLRPLEVTGQFSPEAGERAAEQLVPKIRAGEVDGVFFSSDPMALAGMRVFRSQGISIPEDVRVIGFDDIDASASASPPLTTIENSARELGRAAVDMLTAIRQGTWDGEPVLIGTRLVKRESC